MNYCLYDAFSKSIYHNDEVASLVLTDSFLETNESPATHVPIYNEIKRPFLTDDLCLKVAMMLNYVPVTQNIQKKQTQKKQKYFNEDFLSFFK